MAAEVAIIELLGEPRGCPVRYTMAEATTVAKGTVMQITDPRTASAHSNIDQPIAGILAMEKVGGDGSTVGTVYTNGIFDITAAAAGAVAIGKVCAASATANMFTMSDANDMLQNSMIGYCMEAADNDERVAVRILK